MTRSFAGSLLKNDDVVNDVSNTLVRPFFLTGTKTYKKYRENVTNIFHVLFIVRMKMNDIYLVPTKI